MLFKGNTNFAVYENDSLSDPVLNNCLCFANPDGDYLNEGTTPVNGAAAINALPDGLARNTVDGNPRPVNIPGTGASGANEFDIEAYEAQLRPGIHTTPVDALLLFGNRILGTGPSAPQDVVITNWGFSPLTFIDELSPMAMSEPLTGSMR